MNPVYYFYVVNILIFGYIFYSVFKDIKNADSENRPKKILIYGGIIAGCAILYVALRTYAAGPLEKIYYYLAG